MKMSFLRDFRSLLYSDILRRKKTTPFLILVSTFVSFLATRLFVVLFPTRSLFIKGYHIHHFFFGIILICITGWVALVSDRKSLQRLSAVIYGIGLGMLLDEIGLLLTCGTIGIGCDYWHRTSYDFFIIAIVLFLAAIYFEPFWRKMKGTFDRIFKRKKSFWP